VNLAWHWQATAASAPPRAGGAHGPVAARLHRRLAALPAARRAALTATAADHWLVVLGPSDDLPWADGVRYAAPHPASPALWLPTHCAPDAPPDLLWRALERRHGRAPLLLWPEPEETLPLDRALAVDDALLAAIAARWQGAAAR
jgi:hypothetical protein